MWRLVLTTGLGGTVLCLSLPRACSSCDGPGVRSRSTWRACTVLLVSVLCFFVYDSLGSAMFTVFIAIGLMARSDLPTAEEVRVRTSVADAVRVVRRRGRAPALARAVGRARTSRAARHRAGQPHRDAYLFPSERRPRLLVPADVPGSSSMLRRLGAGALRRRRTGPRPAGALGPVACVRRSPGGRCCACRERDPAADSDRDPPRATTSGLPVRVGVLLGTRRVNQKPVLQVFDLDGRLLGYAKVGHNELTAALVRREAAALAVDRSPGPTVVPGASPARPRPVGRPRRPGDVTPRREPRCRRRPARRAGRTPCARSPHSTGPHHARRCARAASGTALRARRRPVVDRAVGRPAAGRGRDGRAAPRRATRSRLGGWHGDWSRWNMNIGDGVRADLGLGALRPRGADGLRRRPLRRPGDPSGPR